MPWFIVVRHHGIPVGSRGPYSSEARAVRYAAEVSEANEGADAVTVSVETERPGRLGRPNPDAHELASTRYAAAISAARRVYEAERVDRPIEALHRWRAAQDAALRAYNG